MFSPHHLQLLQTAEYTTILQGRHIKYLLLFLKTIVWETKERAVDK